jgi:hypothetical protein
LVQAADKANYIIGAGTYSGSEQYNEFGLVTGHVYTILSAFTMKDA